MWAEFGNVTDVVEGGLAKMINVGVKGEMNVKFYTQVGDCR